jgi:glycosyltransferase involved in cell wall biosynthesis
MRIGIDLSIAATQRAGVANYAFNLVKALIGIDQVNQYYIYSHTPIADLEVGQKNNVQLIYPKHKINRHLWFQLVLPFSLAKNKIDLFFGPNFMFPLFSRVRSAIVIHDLSFMLYPETQSFFNKLYRKLLPYCARRAARIITDCSAIKAEVVKCFRVVPEKIIPIYAGVGREFRTIEDTSCLTRIRQKYHLPEKFVLYVGTLEPRKNIIRLLEAFALVKKVFLDLKLVLVGKKGWLYQEIFNKIRKLGLENEIIIAGHVLWEDLPAIYNLALVFTFPSLYEGFGLPVLEAMACGVPVVTSNCSSLPEVAGEAALLVDPKSATQIADAIKRFLSDAGLREQMIKKGRARVVAFTWEKCAQKVLGVLSELYGLDKENG